MYKKILVPLDGSELAECVLPHVETLVKGCQVSEIIFIRVVEPFRPPATGEYIFPPEQVQRVEAELKAEAEKYLARVAQRVNYGDIKPKKEVVRGTPAESIADAAAKSGADLIVIATHGRSGPSRWVWGSVADRVLRSSCTPVLMVRAPGCVPGL